MTQNNALEFKGRMLSLTRVRILRGETAAIAAQLRDFARQMPQAVLGMPVLLEADMPVALGPVLPLLRDVGMQLLGVVEGPLAAEARQMGLPVLPVEAPGRGARAATPAPTPAPAAAAPPPPPPPAPVAAREPSRMISEPVRSGQQIYAAGGDLVVSAVVSAGAEVVADGCIHIYGPLRGRAIAGARGDKTARIFCRRLEAELVAVAGVYAVAEQMQGELRGKPVQVYLGTDGKLNIERLDA
ncbi:septum site-determining protein MinC [Solimonas aquatica]|uniref:Probable septum site-determining protein MinC n=1 Tax=Solimonas aquatica TaxID=489703 RepID=A0A1H9CRR9_9GAMM|nr:septum site-determining protein MinC [Solimonas aquatica]SEQ03821.1 septum site-determining protein MinC [Solimonas aquatica]